MPDRKKPGFPPQPGEFHTEPPSFDAGDAPPEIPPDQEQEIRELEPTSSERLVQSYQVFQKDLGLEPQVVYYPGSAVDVSPSDGFVNSHVIYADNDPRAIDALKGKGYDAHEVDASGYTPEQATDVVVLLNVGTFHGKALEKVPVGGHVICNDYHATATDMRGNADFEIVGILSAAHSHGGAVKFDQSNPEQYWETVSTDDEFKSKPFSWNHIGYEQALEIVLIELGREPDNVIEEYLKILERVKEEKRLENERMQAEIEAEFGDSDVQLPDLTQDGGLPPMLIVDGKTHFLMPLPPKKGTSDDLFVFKRVKEPSKSE